MADDPPHNYPAYMLGEYTVVGKIAEATFGKVKMAVHTAICHKPTIELIWKHAIAKHRTKTRVQRVVEYMRTLRDPHIIKLHLYALGHYYRARIRGPELFIYIISNGRMSELQARRFFQELMSGIEASVILQIDSVLTAQV